MLSQGFRNGVYGVVAAALVLAFSSTRAVAGDQVAEIKQFLEEWRKAWEATPTAGVEPMRRYYHPKFVKVDKRRNRDQLLKRLKAQASSATEIRVTLLNVRIGKASRGRHPQVTVKFRQQYEITGSYFEEGEKTLLLRHENGAWTLLRENFVEDRSILLALKSWIVEQDMKFFGKGHQWDSVRISWSGFKAHDGFNELDCNNEQACCSILTYKFKRIVRESPRRTRIFAISAGRDCHDEWDGLEKTWVAERDAHDKWTFKIDH